MNYRLLHDVSLFLPGHPALTLLHTWNKNKCLYEKQNEKIANLSNLRFLTPSKQSPSLFIRLEKNGGIYVLAHMLSQRGNFPRKPLHCSLLREHTGVEMKTEKCFKEFMLLRGRIQNNWNFTRREWKRQRNVIIVCLARSWTCLVFRWAL